MKCGECPVAATNPKDKMDCYFCPFDKVDAFHSLHDCSHLSELVERMAKLLKEREAVKPTLIREGQNKHYNDYVCPRCDNEVVYEQNYCTECGTQFLWEGR